MNMIENIIDSHIANAEKAFVENEELIELYEERAAIMEFDGGLTREQAERAAYLDVKKAVGKEE